MPSIKKISENSVTSEEIQNQSCEKDQRTNTEIKYVFNDLGFIDWRKMIPDKFIVINDQKYPDLLILSEEERKNIPEDAKLIKLSGFRYLARLRGYKEMSIKVVSVTETNVVSSCRIEWVPTRENPYGLSTEISVSVEKDKLDPLYQQYAVVIAGNRAFSKCVREALEIDISGQEEVAHTNNLADKARSDSKPAAVKTTQAILIDKMGSRTFEDIIKVMEALGIEIKETYKSVDDLPPSVCVSVIAAIK